MKKAKDAAAGHPGCHAAFEVDAARELFNGYLVFHSNAPKVTSLGQDALAG